VAGQRAIDRTDVRPRPSDGEECCTTASRRGMK
jgi:hypothetical protein